MSKNNNQSGPTFRISQKERDVQQSIRDGEESLSVTPEAGTRNASKPIEHKEGDGYHRGRKTPKPEAVTTVDPSKNAGKAIECAEKQNKMSPDGQLAQLPAGRKHLTTTSSGN